jgi:hypothetical protein
MTSRERTIAARIDFLKQMDTYLYENVGEDIIFGYWLAEGLEDGGADDPDILRSYAEDDKAWIDCVKCFAKCIREEEGR